MSVTTIIDARGISRRVKYKYRYQDLQAGKSIIVKKDDPTLHSQRVLAYRWNKVNPLGHFLVTKITKRGNLKITRWR